MTKKYVYFVSYVLKKDEFKTYGSREISLNEKITSIKNIHHIEEWHLNIVNEPFLKGFGYKNMVILNFILLREEESE